MSLETANLWFNASNGMLLLGAFLVVVGTYGVYKAGAIKERYANERIAANEAKFADRRLSDAQVAEIAEQLKAFPGQQYQFLTFWGAPEPMAILGRIEKALDAAGWMQLPHNQMIMLGPVVGMTVVALPSTSPATKDAAAALVSALGAEGIEVHRDPGNPRYPADNVVHITIGTKY